MQTINDKLKAAIVLLFVGILLTSVYRCARAEWFPEAAIFVDVTRDSEGFYCRHDDHHASHIGATVDLWRREQHTIRTLWVHNSCVEEQFDKLDRDTIGIGYEYRLW